MTIITYSLAFIIKGIAMMNLATDLKNPIFELSYLTNSGAAFSSFSGASLFLAIFGLIIIFAIVYYICYQAERLSFLKIFFFSSLTAGIAGNIYERIAYGHVIDYIQLKHILFPVFNFQDILIVVSCIILVILFYFCGDKKVKNIEIENADE